MHDRNIFKNQRPDFDALAEEFPDFKKYLQTSAAGKSYLSFKDPASLRALTTVLLKKHFQLSLDIPLDRLIPTVPLRLNYIHWLEDLVGTQKENVHGIDIGCGASCIYGLLGHQMNQWKFVATEIDELSYVHANDNVKHNGFSNAIKVLKVSPDEPYFKQALSIKDIKTIDFTLCNPPFFDEMSDEQYKNRTSHRPAPASVSTASDMESYTYGGELYFVKKMIEESLNIQNQVRWFTTMLGKKASLISLRKFLKEKKIYHTSTTFQQGKTLRWGLAWSFIETSLKFNPIKREKKAKTFEIVVTKEYLNHMSVNSEKVCTTLYNLINHVQQEFDRLELETEHDIEHITLGNHDSYEFIATAFKNTWIHQRKKRRQENRMKNDQEKLRNEQKHFEKNSTEEANEVNIQNCFVIPNQQNLNLSEVEVSSTSNSMKRKCDDDTDFSTKKIKAEEESIEPLFKISCSVSTRKVKKDVEYIVTLLRLEGSKDLCHQLCLYMNNFLKKNQS